MIYYTNQQTLEVWGYNTDEEAQSFNTDYVNLIPMTNVLFLEYQEQRIGHRWSLGGWIYDEEL